MTLVLLAAVAGAGFALSGLAGVLGVRIGPTARAASVAVASGILIAISVAELFPHALEEGGHQRAALGFLGGFLFLFLVEVATKGHTHHGENADFGGHGHTHDHELGEHGHDGHHHHPLLPFLVGLGMHNLVDGISIGTGGELNTEAGSAILIGVLVHQLPVGLSFAAVLAAEGLGRRAVVRSAVLLGLAIPLGALLVGLASPDLGHADLAILTASAAGALAYIGTGHLLPAAHAEQRSVAVGAGFPLALLGTALLVLFGVEH